jgi:hypothetical protein
MKRKHIGNFCSSRVDQSGSGGKLNRGGREMERKKSLFNFVAIEIGVDLIWKRGVIEGKQIKH